MTPKREKRPLIGGFLLTCAAVIVWGVGKMFFKVQAKDFSASAVPPLAPPTKDHSTKEPPAEPGLPVESLSGQSLGNAPLDHLARSAAAEEGSVPRITYKAAVQSDETTLNVEATIHAEDEVLKHQSLESAPLPGWNVPAPERLPVPTFAPAIMAMGIVVFAMGIVTTWYVGLVGVLVFAVAVWRWVGELQGE
jgi:hypothetical protein